MCKWQMGLGSAALLGVVVVVLAQIWLMDTPPTHGAWRDHLPASFTRLLLGWHLAWEPVRNARPHRNPARRQRLDKTVRLRLLRRLGLRPPRRHASASALPVVLPPSIPHSPTLSPCAPTSAPPSATETPQGTPKRRRGRPTTVSTATVCCPEQTCRGGGKFGGHPDHCIVGYGTYTTRSGTRQLYRCEWCGKIFSETQGTVFFGLKTPEATVYQALACLAEGMGIRATARVFGVKPEDILRWLRRAGQHCEQVSAYLMRNLHVEQAQLDELWTFVRKKEKMLSAWEQLHTDWGDTWIWTVFDPVSKLVLAFYVGERTETEAVGVVRHLKAVLAEGCVPLFTSDQLPHYLQALLQIFGRWVQPKRKGTRGRFPKPRLEPPENLHYATVHKERESNRVVGVSRQVIFGSPAALWARLKALGVRKINTAFVERMNLSLRHLVSRLKRRGLNFSKRREDLGWHLHLSVAYYHFVLPHRGLRRRLAQPVPTRGTPKQWEQRTPAMAAGLTDHVWDMCELLRFRVPAVAT
jgi:transposase-like protein/IS1 family transposase